MMAGGWSRIATTGLSALSSMVIWATLPGCDTDCDPLYHATMSVMVVDADGAPVSGAVVIARDVASMATVEGETGSDGTTIMGGSGSGSGTSVVTATFEGRSASAEVDWRCASCLCQPTPSWLELVL